MIAAARLPLRSDPANSQLGRPSAHGRIKRAGFGTLGKRQGKTPVPKPGLGAFICDGKVQSISYISLRRISCIYTSCGMVKLG